MVLKHVISISKDVNSDYKFPSDYAHISILVKTWLSFYKK